MVNGINLSIKKGEKIAISGPNGSGKSSFANSLLAQKGCSVSGRIEFEGRDITTADTAARAKAGLFLSHQFSPVLPGISLMLLIRKAAPFIPYLELNQRLEAASKSVGISLDELRSRSLNEGFSGGERKKIELLQYLLLKPKLGIFDEIDSGLDQEGQMLLASIIDQIDPEKSLIFITHNPKMIQSINFNSVYSLRDGRLELNG